MYNVRHGSGMDFFMEYCVYGSQDNNLCKSYCLFNISCYLCKDESADFVPNCAIRWLSQRIYAV